MNKEFNIQQLVSYLTGNCSKNEQKVVEHWLTLSDENMLLYEEFKQVWESSAAGGDSCLVDIDKAWGNFKSRANFNETTAVETIESKKHFTKRSFFVVSSRIAAIIVVVFGLYLLIDRGNQVENYSYTAATALLDSPFVLPDGSNVTMNEGAEINYREYFSSDIRTIDFKGEAFFDVAHNPDKPMIIAAGNVRVKVLGTSFNLCNCVHSNEITVHLETGKVLFYSVDENDGSILEQIILLPGQKGVYNKTTGSITKHQVNNSNHLAWKTGALEFVNAPLPEVIKVLERTYRINVKSEVSVEDYKLTARYNNETPHSIFESLQIIYGLDYEINGESVIIY